MFSEEQCPWSTGRAARRAARWIVLAGLFITRWALGQGTAQPPFNVLIGRPTDQSIAVSVLATVDCQIIVDYGTQSGSYAFQSVAATLAAQVPGVVTLASLQPGTRYYYRIRYLLSGAAAYSAAAEASFMTQRMAGQSFTFGIEADPHYRDDEPGVWNLTMANMLGDKPDFLVDIGDTFMDEKFGATTLAQVMLSHKTVRTQYFAQIGASIPTFLVSGNHDPELGWLLSSGSPHANVATWGVQARQLYFPCPIAGSFYSGATVPDPYTGAPRDAYYAFTWGDALFVMIDPYWYTSQATAHAQDPWNWTLGKAQYDWLTGVLQQSHAAFKFIFTHHLVGGSLDGLGRGGVEVSSYYEWGGNNVDDTPGFSTHRPGWAAPIQSLLLANNVSAVFHGHDHLYVKQVLSSSGPGVPQLIYQEVPQPSRSNQSVNSAIAYGYLSGVMYPSSGYFRVQVTPKLATVSYVRSVIPTDTSAINAGASNGLVTYSYTIPASP